jgi:hypothetical protein
MRNNDQLRLRALENATGVGADLTICIRNVGSVAHQAAGFGILTLCKDCGNWHGPSPSGPIGRAGWRIRCRRR